MPAANHLCPTSKSDGHIPSGAECDLIAMAATDVIAPPRFDDARFWRQVCGILPKVGWKLNCIPK